MKRLMRYKLLSWTLILLLLTGLVATMPVTYAEDGVKYQHRDDFNSFNSDFWKVIDRYGDAMDMTELSNGILTLKATETDNYPTLISKEIPIEMGDTLIVKRRVYAHPDHDKFSEGTYITEESDTTWNTSRDRSYNFLLFFQHLYFTYDKGRYPEQLTKGNFGHARIEGFSKLNQLSPENYGITSSTLDQWVEEEFIYETATGKVTITSAGETMTFQSRVLSKPYVRYHMSPWGWFTGQYNQLDWIEFKVVGPGADGLIEDNSNPIEDNSNTGVVGSNVNSKVQGKVIDAITGAPISGVNVQLFSESELVLTAATDHNGEYAFETYTGSYSMRFDKAGYNQSKYYAVENHASQIDHMQTVELVAIGTADGSITGRVVNAVTGEPIADAYVSINKDINNVTDTPYWKIITDNNGNFEFSAIAGNYTVVASKNGFIQSQIPMTLVSGTNSPLGDLAISPELDANQMRIVLKWGDTSKDLDGHLVGPTSEGWNKHIFYSDKEFSNATTSMVLDVDDRTTGGPETITISNPQSGMYEYYVHNYVSYGSGSTTALPNSQAVVEVYMGNQLLQRLNVPSQEGRYWKVFAFDGSEFKPLNVMMNEFSFQ